MKADLLYAVWSDLCGLFTYLANTCSLSYHCVLQKVSKILVLCSLGILSHVSDYHHVLCRHSEVS